MSNLNVTGIVIRQQQISEKDKLVTLLTAERGVIYAFARGARKLGAKLFSITQPFAYSRFTLFQGRDKYIIDSGELLKSFGGEADSIEKLSLMHYYADISRRLVPRETDGTEMLRLFLNTSYFLLERKYDIMLLKCIFELRAAAISGFMPAVDECVSCGAEVSDGAIFNPDTGDLFCKSCGKAGTYLDSASVAAMRYICFVDFERLFSFKVSDETLKALGAASEKYIESVCSGHPDTLDFFKSVI